MSIVNTLKNQFDRGWKMIDATVATFSDSDWRSSGRDYLCPARLAYHLAESAERYVSGREDFQRGQRFKGNWKEMPATELPSQEDMVTYFGEVKQKTDSWLGQHDDESILGPNTHFPNCGETVLDVAIYILRHSLHHHGELNALSVINGNETDNWA